ncbi:MAG: orotidine-5'-phosphate decarboxylase [Kiloniellaceae bacterium]
MNMKLSPRERIFVGLDTPDVDKAARLASSLVGTVGGVKIGKELFTAQGPDGVRKAAGGAPLFLDLKFHDIPNTVAGAVRAAVRLSPRILNVHTSGGRAMMSAAAEAAREAAETLNIERPRVIGVTVLTSLDASDLEEVGQKGPVEDQVERLARLAQASGLDGVVCSPKEISRLRAACGPNFLLVVPGIRPVWSGAGDQKRVMTPEEAIAAGADHIVIGRPITSAEDPLAAARRIVADLEDTAATV